MSIIIHSSAWSVGLYAADVLLVLSVYRDLLITDTALLQRKSYARVSLRVRMHIKWVPFWYPLDMQAYDLFCEKRS